jgi:hypothetical protein
MNMDWQAWHGAYDDPESALSQRLVIAQHEIHAAMDNLPDRSWQVISLCAGDGRDLLEALSTHPRRADVHGLLVELDPDIAESARSSGTCPQPQTGLLSLVSGARKTTPETGHAMDRRSSPTS